ncbi:MAG: hypothetical protein Q9160_004734 [Pyrenula sp. 1 TL-2023]
MFDRLLPRVGFPWAVRSIAFVALGTYVFSYPALFYKPPKMASVRRLIDLSALTDVPFVCTTLAGFFSGIAYYVPLLYIPLFADTKIPGFSNTGLVLYVISIVNAASIFGRVGGGILAAKTGPLETCCIALGCSALLLPCWIAVDSIAGVIVWSVFWGLISSVIVSLPGAFVPILCPSLAVVGTRSGMFWAAIGLGLLIGSPIAGALIENDEGDPAWWRLQVFSGIMMLVSAICLIQPVLHAYPASYTPPIQQFRSSTPTPYLTPSLLKDLESIRNPLLRRIKSIFGLGMLLLALLLRLLAPEHTVRQLDDGVAHVDDGAVALRLHELLAFVDAGCAGLMDLQSPTDVPCQRHAAEIRVRLEGHAPVTVGLGRHIREAELVVGFAREPLDGCDRAGFDLYEVREDVEA